MKKYTNENGDIITAGTPIVVTVIEGTSEMKYKMYSPSHEQYLNHGWSEYVAPTSPAPPPQTEEERLSNIKVKSLKSLTDAIAALHPDKKDMIIGAIQSDASVMHDAYGAEYVSYLDPMVQGLAQSFGFTSEEVEEFFIMANLGINSTNVEAYLNSKNLSEELI